MALALLNFRCVETPTENHLEQPLHLLTLQEAAELLQVSQRTVNRQKWDGTLVFLEEAWLIQQSGTQQKRNSIHFSMNFFRITPRIKYSEQVSLSLVEIGAVYRLRTAQYRLIRHCVSLS